MSDENKIKVSASPCLTEQEMTDYIRHKLSPEQRNRVEKHLLECDLCADAMEGLSMMANTDALDSLDELISKRISAEAAPGQGKLLSMRFNYRVAAVLAFIGIAGGVLYFILSDTGKNEKVLSQNIKPYKSADTTEAANRSQMEEAKASPASSLRAGEKKMVANVLDSDASHATRHKHITNTVKAATEQKKMMQTTVTQEEKALTLQAHAGEITGKVIDKQSKEPVPFATVTAELNGAVVSGAQTDINGVYSIKQLEPGDYSIKVNYMGYTTSEVADVIVSAKNSKEMDLAMNKGVELGAATVVGYKAPLIDKGNTSTQTTLSQQEIVNAPTRDENNPAPATPPSGYQEDAGGALNVRGSRNDATQHYAKSMNQASGASGRSKGVAPTAIARKDSSFSVAMRSYNQKQYNAAVQLFNDYLKKYPDDEKATFYDAVSNFSIDSAAAALTQLERVLDNEKSEFHDDANWYKALALKKLHRNKEAKALLREIKKSNSKHSDDAADMLDF